MQIQCVWNRAVQTALLLALGLGGSPERVRASGPAEVTQFPISTGTLAIRAGATPMARQLRVAGRWQGGVAAVDPTREASTLHVAAGPGEGDSGAIALDPARWHVLPHGRGFRYVDTTRSAGGVARIVLRTRSSGVGRLEIRAGGPTWPYEILADHSVVSVLLSIGDARWCALFPDPITSDHKVRARSERAPATCPPHPAGDVLRTPDARFLGLADYPFAPHYVQTGRLRIHYVDSGPPDADPVLLLHGEPSWSYLYRKMIPILAAAGLRVIAPDLVGFGKSDKPAELDDYSYQNHVDWVRHFVSELDLEHITLFAQDWGGLIGLRLVAEDGERFDRVVAANTFLPTGDIPPSPAFLAFRAFMLTTPSVPIGGLLQGGTVGVLPPAVIAAYEAPFPDESFKAGARIFPQLVPITPDDPASEPNRRAWQVLRAFEKPFLTAFSDSDPITAGGDLLFQALIPGTSGQPHTTIMNAGHFLQEDAGEELGALVAEFIRVTSP